jgi:ABC-2 type transport system ATP-binding protein
MSVAGGGKKIPSLLKMAENSGVKVNAVDLHRPTLEDVFIHFTGKSIRAHEASSNERLRNHMRARMRR